MSAGHTSSRQMSFAAPTHSRGTLKYVLFASVPDELSKVANMICFASQQADQIFAPGAPTRSVDEPFEALAPVIVRDLVKACRDLADAGQTIVLVEQNLAAALALVQLRPADDRARYSLGVKFRAVSE